MSTDCLESVAILWDIENCGVPHGVNAEDVAVHIRMALKFQLAVKGPVTVFSAYGDFSHLPLRTRQGCQKTGVDLIDIPHGKKDAADKAILVDMFLFALDNPPPCTVVLISGDVDFAPALHKLGQRGYSVVLAIPSGRKVSPALLNACQHLWNWPDIAHGKGTHPTHNACLQLTLQERYREDTSPSTIVNPGKTPITCAAILGNKPSETVVPNVENAEGKGSTSLTFAIEDSKPSEAIAPNAENAEGKGSTSLTFAIEDSKPSEAITPNAENVCIEQVIGNDHGEKCLCDGIGDHHHNFGKLEVGPNGNQIANGVSKKIPVDMFEEHIKAPFYIVKESTEIPVVTRIDHNGMEATGIPVVTSHGRAGFAKKPVEISMVIGRDSNGMGAFHMNRSMFPPSCGTACPVASHGMIGYENIPNVTSQGMNGPITNFIPLGSQHVSDQFAIPYPGGLTGAFVVGKEVFGHSWKGLAHQMEADYELHFAGLHHKAGAAKDGPLFNMGHKLANTPAQYALPADRGWENHCSFPSNPTHANVQGPITRSQNIRQLFANLKRAKAASKQAVQLKMKKKKMKKSKKTCIAEADPAATPKLTRKQRKAARLAAIQTQGSVLNNSLASDKIFEPHS